VEKSHRKGGEGVQIVDRNLLIAAVCAALKASEAILEVYRTDFTVELKDDLSPVTAADRRSHEILLEALSRADPSYPVLSEEGEKAPASERSAWNRVWLVDPLDGTKEFVARNGQFGINVALIEAGEPILGVVYVPLSKTLYFGGRSLGAWRLEAADVVLRAESDTALGPGEIGKLWELVTGEAQALPDGGRPEAGGPLKAVVSRSHMNEATEAFLEKLRAHYGSVEISSAGSAVKLCVVAEGNADVYPRFAPTKEWDTAAGDAILRETGGVIVRAEDRLPLRYNKEDLLNPSFIACSSWFAEQVKAGELQDL